MESTRRVDRFRDMRSLVVIALAGCSSAGPPPVTSTTVARPNAAIQPTENPCFPTATPIRAIDMWHTLEKYSWSVYLQEGEPTPPPTTYGSCNVNLNKVTAADGHLVAELGCGVRVLGRGIVDPMGLQIGAAGKDVLDRWPHRGQPLTCMANGPDQVRCRFDLSEAAGDDEHSYFVVAGSLGEAVLTGEAAVAYFAPRPLVELDVSVWCH